MAALRSLKIIKTSSLHELVKHFDWSSSVISESTLIESAKKLKTVNDNAGAITCTDKHELEALELAEHSLSSVNDALQVSSDPSLVHKDIDLSRIFELLGDD
jgi:hypothetical protein